MKPQPVPEPGQQARWRHPRLAFALGRFNAIGPGPFQVVAIRNGIAIVTTERTVAEVEAAWIGPVEPEAVLVGATSP